MTQFTRIFVMITAAIMFCSINNATEMFCHVIYSGEYQFYGPLCPSHLKDKADYSINWTVSNLTDIVWDMQEIYPIYCYNSTAVMISDGWSNWTTYSRNLTVTVSVSVPCSSSTNIPSNNYSFAEAPSIKCIVIYSLCYNTLILFLTAFVLAIHYLVKHTLHRKEKRCPLKDTLIVPTIADHCGSIVTLRDYDIKVAVPSRAYILVEPIQYTLHRNQEQCPLKDTLIATTIVDHCGSIVKLTEHNVTVIIPCGAIATNDQVEIQVAASFFGPFTIPKGYRPISAYVWIQNCYEFKKPLKVEIEHNAYVSSTEDISNLCVLKTCEHDGQLVMHEVAQGYNFEINSPFCTYFSSHFCSLCLAAKSTSISNRIMAYQYLPENYKLVNDFRAEICFCYDMRACRNRIEERFAERRMLLDTAVLVRSHNEAALLLSNPIIVGKWKVVILKSRISVMEINFREWYSCDEDLRLDEDKDIYPPRFLIQFNCREFSTLDVTYKLCIRMQQKILMVSTFAVFVKAQARCTADASKSATVARVNATPISTYNELLVLVPTMKSISKTVIPKIKSNWKHVGRFLAFDENTISRIETESNMNLQECCHKVFSTWLFSKQEYNNLAPKTWNTLIRGIKQIDGAIADEIERELHQFVSK